MGAVQHPRPVQQMPCAKSKRGTPTNFTDNDFHNIGIGIIRHNVVARRARPSLCSIESASAIDHAALQTDLSALGRYLVTKKPTPTSPLSRRRLRNVLVTAPYFHDGSQATLWDVVDHYNKGDGLQDPWLDEDIQPLALREGTSTTWSTSWHR